MNTVGNGFVAGILRDVFGVSSPVYLPWLFRRDYKAAPYTEAYTDDGIAIGRSPFSGIQTVTPDEAERMSSFGTPVMGSFAFEAGEYNSYDRQGRMIKVRMEDFIMPEATIVEFNRDMVMTQTRTLGNTGTVKEIYGLDDWKINIRGLCLNDRTGNASRTAQEQEDELVRWRNICDSIGVAGGIFERKNIRRMVIESFSLLPIQGKWNVRPFEITACSDEAIELAYL
jgi:hypothetical protein